MATSDEAPAGVLLKRSMRIAGHRTSLALEREFWAALESVALSQRRSLPVLIAEIDRARARERPHASLASAARLFALEHAIPPNDPSRASKNHVG
ncbi:MAG: ribbon-helix-helix domain-containing protein [Caulobacteraceae bacterium]|jgi:predicted DNA-binding ribbon-helix-helix protein|nr:ribbon-helix-helix domain-containing protein [Caulobacteraceae bacterium]